MAIQASDISNALLIKKDAAVIATPPTNGIVARWRQP